MELSTHDPRWLALIQADSKATIFHHPAWLGLLSTCYGYRPFIYGKEDPADGAVSAALPFAEVHNYITPRRWVALPFSDFCPPLYRDEGSLAALIESLVGLQRSGKCPRVEIRSRLPRPDQMQAVSAYVLHTVSLAGGEKQVMKGIHRTQMQNVHTAEKNGIRITQGNGLEEMGAFYRLHCLTRRKHGVPVQPWKFFETLVRQVLASGLGFVMLAYRGDTCISGGVFLHWGKTLTYKYSATDETCMNLRPNHLVTWTAMQWGMEHGFTSFDFGRADLEDEGLRTYKRRWGAAEEPLCYSYCPAASQTAQGNGWLSSLIKYALRRSPLWFCQAAGSLLYRYVG